MVLGSYNPQSTQSACVYPGATQAQLLTHWTGFVVSMILYPGSGRESGRGACRSGSESGSGRERGIGFACANPVLTHVHPSVIGMLAGLDDKQEQTSVSTEATILDNLFFVVGGPGSGKVVAGNLSCYYYYIYHCYDCNYFYDNDCDDHHDMYYC